MLHTVEIDLDGQKITLETGKIAKQANGAVVVRSGDTVVLVSACSNEEPKAGSRIFPAHGRLPRIHLRRRQDFPAASSNARGVPRKKKSSPAG